MNSAQQSLDTRLAVLAAELVLPGLPVVPDRVIPLALDLLAANRGTPGTVEVGALAPGSTMRDAEDSIRQMLAEQGIDFPESVDTEEGQYAVALWALGNGGLSVGEFSVSFYPRLPAVGQQNETDQELVLLLDDWERESDPSLRRRVEARIREVAARAWVPYCAAPTWRLRLRPRPGTISRVWNTTPADTPPTVHVCAGSNE